MKNIHPKYNHNTQVTCSCGNTFTTGSTLDTIQVEICSKCHPFFTGEMRFVDTQGRVEKFQAKRDNAAKFQKTVGKKAGKEEKVEEAPKTLKEMLEAAAKKGTN